MSFGNIQYYYVLFTIYHYVLINIFLAHLLQWSLFSVYIHHNTAKLFNFLYIIYI